MYIPISLEMKKYLYLQENTQLYSILGFHALYTHPYNVILSNPKVNTFIGKNFKV